MHHHVPAGLRVPAQHQVDLMPVEQGAHPVAVPGLQPYPGLRVALPEPAQYPRHDLLGRGGDRGDPQLAALGVGGVRRGPGRLVEQAHDAACVPAYAVPALVSRSPRPSGVTSATPSDFCSAATEADTAAWVTTSSCAAARTDPLSATARKVRSWLSVTVPRWPGNVKGNAISHRYQVNIVMSDPGQATAGGSRPPGAAGYGVC